MSRLPRMRWLKRSLVVLTCMLALAGVSWAIWENLRAKGLTGPDQVRRAGRPLPGRTEQVEETQVDQAIGAKCLTSASEMAIIRLTMTTGFSRTDAVVTAIHAHEGDYVQKDQPLFDVRDTVFRAALVQSQANLAATQSQLKAVQKQLGFNVFLAEQELEAAKAELEYRQKDLEVRGKQVDINRQLLKTKSVSYLDLLSAFSTNYQAGYNQRAARFRLKQAEVKMQMVQLKNRAKLTKAEKEVEQARLEVAASQRDLERCCIRSPLAGIVDRVDIVPGQMLQIFRNGQTLTSVLKLDPIYVLLDFPQERIGELAVGQKVQVVLDSFPRESFDGTVIRISPQVKPDSHVLPVTVEVCNPNNRIRAGMSGYARLHIKKTVKAVSAHGINRRPEARGTENYCTMLRRLRSG